MLHLQFLDKASGQFGSVTSAPLAAAMELSGGSSGNACGCSTVHYSPSS